MNCPHMPGCTLGQTLQTAPALRVWQTFFCENGFERCERLKLLRAGSLVPTNLLPNGTWLGSRTLARAGDAKRLPEGAWRMPPVGSR